MSGHSKWNNIKRKKEKTDGARAKGLYQDRPRDQPLPFRDGGPNPASNTKLADSDRQGKAPTACPTITSSASSSSAEGGDKTEYEAITYEGYGPGGVAVMVETLTDNRNRTAADLRHYFDKNGGNLGADGLRRPSCSPRRASSTSTLEDKDPDQADDGRTGRRCRRLRCRRRRRRGRHRAPRTTPPWCEALEREGLRPP